MVRMLRAVTTSRPRGFIQNACDLSLDDRGALKDDADLKVCD